VDGLRPLTTPQSTVGSTNRPQIDLEESLIRSNRPVTIAVDSSAGVKVHNGGDWVRHVWKVKKGYLKIYFAVDIKTKQVVSIDGRLVQEGGRREEAGEAGEEGRGEREDGKGPSRRGVRLESQLQLPRGGGGSSQ
jgi:hypothetical protein